MRLRRGTFVVSVAVLAAACTRGEAPPVRAAAAPPFAASPGPAADLLALNDVMEWVVEPAADVVFAAAGLQAPADRRPIGAPAWQAVADAAQQLAEQGRLLMQPAFATHRADWQGLAAAMHRSASDAAEAARRHDADRAATASDALRASCQGCHLRYAPALARRVGETR
ncbi:MAG TPA: hypothetical protein VF169_08040 [Albitalea sp.]|uniref:hypothetical protein n=1 Tax=Piscinibacter sp. TaxID=1903157 RepID=UPI002ED2CD10